MIICIHAYTRLHTSRCDMCACVCLSGDCGVCDCVCGDCGVCVTVCVFLETVVCV